MLKAFDLERWAELADARMDNVANSIAILRGLHLRWAVLLDSLDDAAWERTGRHPERGDLTLLDVISHTVDHSSAHLDQIARTLTDRG